MMSLRSLLVLYISFCLLWSLILIYYLNRALVSHRQPRWLKIIITNGSAGEMVLFGSVVLSPLFIFFTTLTVFKRLLKGDFK